MPTHAEIMRLAGAVSNQKHKLAIFLLYASGLRVSELIALDVGDLDLDELVIRVLGRAARIG